MRNGAGRNRGRLARMHKQAIIVHLGQGAQFDGDENWGASH